MAYLTESEVGERAARTMHRLRKSAHQVLSEEIAPPGQDFDVFLSHSSSEPEEVLLGVKGLLEDRGLTVYIDKYSDPHMSPDNVSPETAQILRGRLRNSNTLLYVYSRHSTRSRWMPWELGFFDGLKGKVGVVPVTLNQEEKFKGEEYLNLYPHVDIATMNSGIERYLWINQAADTYARLDEWAKGTSTIRKRSS